MTYIIFGILCFAIGVLWIVLSIIYMYKKLQKFADSSLSAYNDYEELSRADEKKIFKKGLRWTIGFSLISAVIACAFMVGSWLLIMAGNGLI